MLVLLLILPTIWSFGISPMKGLGVKSYATSTSRTFNQLSMNANELEKSKFLNYKIVSQINDKHQLPVYVYSEKVLREQATNALNFPHNFGLTVRFAMKSSPNAAILQLFKSMGIHFDASSGYEVSK